MHLLLHQAAGRGATAAGHRGGLGGAGSVGRLRNPADASGNLSSDTDAVSESTFDRPSRLSSLLTRLVRNKGLTERSSLQELDSLWKQSAGERIASRSRVRRLNRGVLEISVSNGAILEELICYLQHDLLTALQQQLPQQSVKSLKFVRVR